MSQTLTLPISEGTQRKLLALTMLQGKKIADIEEELSGYLDELLTMRCAELLGIATIGSAPMPTDSPAPRISFAEALQKTSGARTEALPQEEEFVEVQDAVSGHELSGDEDSGENKSLQEQYEEDDEIPKEGFDLHIPTAKDTDDFVNTAMGPRRGNRESDEMPSVNPRPRQPSPTYDYEGTQSRGATKSFESRRMKGQGARVSEHTGDDD